MLRSSAGRDGFFNSGSTWAILNEDGKTPSAKERLTSLVIMGPSSLKQFFSRDVGMESSLHCLLDEEKIRSWISERVAGRKLSSFGGGAIGDSYGSGERVGVNLVRIRSILSWKNSRKVFARADVSDLSGRVFEEVR